MKTIRKTKRVANFALGLPIALTSLISQAYSSDSNEDHFYNQEKFYERVHAVQMMPVEPKIQIENNELLKEVAFGVCQLNDKNSRIEDHVIFLEQKLEIQMQQNVRLEQQNAEIKQQNVEVKLEISELNQMLKQILNHMQQK